MGEVKDQILYSSGIVQYHKMFVTIYKWMNLLLSFLNLKKKNTANSTGF